MRSHMHARPGSGPMPFTYLPAGPACIDAGMQSSGRISVGAVRLSAIPN